MVEPRELVTVCRQIGGMMEAGVDIIRVMRVLSQQTTNPRLLEVFADIERALRLGALVSEAMERSSDVFSPFAVQLVREGEERRDIPGAFFRVADFLQQEEETAPIFEPRAPSQQFNVAYLGDRSPVTVGVVRELLEGVQTVTLRALTIGAGLLLSLAGVWWSVEEGFVERRWQNVILACVSALFLASSGMWLRHRRDKDNARRRECALCGAEASPDMKLNRLPSVSGAVVCDRCAQTIALTTQSPFPNATPPTPATQSGQTYEVAPVASVGANAQAPDLSMHIPVGNALSRRAPDNERLREERQDARRRYGTLADAPDALGAAPDIYEVGEDGARFASNFERATARAGATTRGATVKTPSNEADFD